ncbi:barstar family protein [Streptomyces sp. JV176]|uniref:barstar family protein n=1 Tax=Streptomyces sp. JV176 TaxID=858630 RepID=UPI002E76028E|nr:barstar family protein [Streptomyces sp. JV176]MEE1804484.1 barstar family protein [Streptomyces sp. JV176]
MSEEFSTTPLYQLAEEESGIVFIEALEMSGFFVESNEVEPGDILIFGSALRPVDLGKDLPDVELRVVDLTGTVIGSYYIGRVRLRSALKGEGGARRDGFVTSFYGHACPYSAAGEIWHRWASGVPLEKAEWVSRPVDSHDSWLHVVQNAWFESGRNAKRYLIEDTHVIDSRNIFGESSFYCELGESVNGPGGYFGSNLDGLADCLASSRASDAPFRLAWRGFSVAQERMGVRLADSVVGILREFGVEVTLQ